MTVRKIVEKYLKAEGYGGLADPYGECGCEIKDLMPCESDGIDQCIPGYRIPCTCGEGCEFHIAIQKPEENMDVDDLIAPSMPRYEQEQHILGALILCGPAALSRGFLKPKDFHFPQHEKIMAAIQKEPAPPNLVQVAKMLVLMGELENVGGVDYLSNIVAQTPVVNNPAEYFNELTREIIKS